ncbi:hypothetical protein N7457_004407 [Penicillium paradoxum]|uniref:uncharacterized protein n=1 Tax=Penicillium paradoxum TaxID=176176 RepID=UPI0025499C60|nr:uncharacterized protein N7457_004407 [Penicillium paradoxum]KAJ5782633.1 hypothetical protein N7457_004407 [Penicillium paradoxum]
MFGTLRYLPEKKAGVFLERELGVAANAATNKFQHSACDNCRVQKAYFDVSNRFAVADAERESEENQAPNASQKRNEICPEIGAEVAGSPTRGDANLQPMEPHGEGGSYVGIDRPIHRIQGNAPSALDLIFKEGSGWSSSFDWLLEGEDAFKPNSVEEIGGLGGIPRHWKLRSFESEGPLPQLSPTGVTLQTHQFTTTVAPTVGNSSNTDITSITLGEQSTYPCLPSAVLLLHELELPLIMKIPPSEGSIPSY